MNLIPRPFASWHSFGRTEKARELIKPLREKRTLQTRSLQHLWMKQEVKTSDMVAGLLLEGNSKPLPSCHSKYLTTSWTKHGLSS